MKLIIPGEPMGKQRPRVTKHGTYTPKKTVNYENLVQLAFINEYKHHKPIEGPIKMNIRAYFQIPQSASKAKKTSMERNNIRPTKRPDWDNVGKIITDALNGLAYQDDKQIVSCTVEKYYSSVPRVLVELEELEEVS